MPLDKSMSHEEMVKELMNKYDRTGTIGNNSPKSRKEALKIANAIAYQTKQEALNEKVNELKECLAMMMDVFPTYAIGQVSSSGEYKSKPKDDKDDGESKQLGDVIDNAN